MADPLSISASIVALLQASGTVVQFIKSARDANKDIKALQVEVIHVRGLLFSLKDLLPDPEFGEESLLPVIECLGGQDGPLKRFEVVLGELVTRLQPKDGLRKLGQVLSWHFKKDEIRDLIGTVERYKTLFSLALQNDQANLTRLISNNIDSLKQDASQVKIGVLDLQRTREDDQRWEIIRWLSSVDMSTNHEAACKKHEPTTGDWFVRSSDFTQWKADPGGFIWLHGFAGCGKTILCSTIIQETKMLVEADPHKVLAYFYFDFGDKEKQNVPGFLLSLIAQISSASPILPDDIKSLYSQSRLQKPSSDIKFLIGVLRSILEIQEQVYIIADALDECLEREDLLEVLSEIADMKPEKLHILVTSRHERDILEGLEGVVTASFSLGGSKVDKDIAIHVHSQVDKHPKLRKWPDAVKADIEKTLITKAQGMFRWVFCQLNTLKTCRKESILREKLKQLPKDLDETYERILQGILEEDADEAFNALQWLAYSERPLYLDELAEAVVLGPDKSSLCNRDRLIDPHEVLHICSSLVVLGNGDKQSTDDDDDDDDHQSQISDDEDENGKTQQRKRVSFAHFSVKEYLVSDRIRKGPASRFSLSGPAAHSFIGQTCLSYLLNFDKKDSLPENPSDVFPLIKYTAENWPFHIRFAQEYPAYSEKTTMLTLELLNSNSNVLLNWLRVYNPISRRRPYKAATALPPLYYASFFKLPAVVKALIQSGADVNENKGCIGTALRAALYSARDNGTWTRARHEVVQLLLDNMADIEARDERGVTALQSPAFWGDLALVRLLLDRGANIEAKSNWGGTALHGAACNGYEEIVCLLLERGADIESKAGRENRTALCSAANMRREGIVQILLERGCNVEARDSAEQTALHLAAICGAPGVAKLLLEAGADITAKNCNGQTALHVAVLSLVKETVQLLLERGADVMVKDDWGQTVLHLTTLGMEEFSQSREALQGPDYRVVYLGSDPSGEEFSRRKEEVSQLLRAKCAKPTGEDTTGRVALPSAAFDGS